MINNIYFIDRFPITKEFYFRSDFEFLKNKGYNVQFLDISKFLKRKHVNNSFPESLECYVKRFSSKHEFIMFLCKKAKDSLVISTVPFISNTAWMYFKIFYYSVPYVLVENTAFPSFDTVSLITEKKHSCLKFIKDINIKKLIDKPFEVLYYYGCNLYLKPARMIITSKIDNKSIFNKLVSNNTIVKYSISPDYKLASIVENTINIEEEYAVFVDQYFVHHPDFKTNHIVHSFTAEQYYGEINNFLVEFQKLTGLKVIIASHPRRKYEHSDDFLADFDLYFTKTAELIKNSKIALIHFSTAISFATIFKKPFVLLNSLLFSNSNINSKIKGFSNYFEVEDIDISKGVEDLKDKSNNLFCYNNNKYEKYVNQYLKHPKAMNLTFGEKILTLIEKIKVDNT